MRVIRTSFLLPEILTVVNDLPCDQGLDRAFACQPALGLDHCFLLIISFASATCAGVPRQQWRLRTFAHKEIHPLQEDFGRMNHLAGGGGREFRQSASDNRRTLLDGVARRHTLEAPRQWDLASWCGAARAASWVLGQA